MITGAGGTLCSEMARSVAGQGYKVALLGRTLGKLDAVREQVALAGGYAISVQCDVSILEEVERQETL